MKIVRNCTVCRVFAIQKFQSEFEIFLKLHQGASGTRAILENFPISSFKFYPEFPLNMAISFVNLILCL